MTTQLADTQFSCVKVASCYRVCGTKSTFIPQTCNVSNKMMLTTKIPSYSSHENANLNSEKIEGRGNAARTAQIGHTCPHGLPAGCQLALWLLIGPGRISSIVFSFYQAACQAEKGEKYHFIKHKTRSCVFCVSSSQRLQPTSLRKNIIWKMLYHDEDSFSHLFFCSHKMRLINYVA